MSVVKSTFFARGWINGRKCGFSRMFDFQRELFMFMHKWHALFVRCAPPDLHVYNSRCTEFVLWFKHTACVYAYEQRRHALFFWKVISGLFGFLYETDFFLLNYQINSIHLAQNVLCEFEWAEPLLYCIYTHF